jgi:hypothetical protein
MRLKKRATRLNERMSCIWPPYKYQVRVWPATHLANFCHSRALGLRRRQRPEHAAVYGARPRRRSIASPSTSAASPGARRRLQPRSTPPTSTTSPKAHRRLQPRSTPSTSIASPGARCHLRPWSTPSSSTASLMPRR